jgi:hypothetical protein
MPSQMQQGNPIQQNTNPINPPQQQSVWNKKIKFLLII